MKHAAKGGYKTLTESVNRHCVNNQHFATKMLQNQGEKFIFYTYLSMIKVFLAHFGLLIC